MIRPFPLSLNASTAFLLLSGIFAGGEIPSPPEGFKSIFNGKDLTGWEGDAKYWKVEDGVLAGTTDGKLDHNRFIVWRGEKVKNFEVRVQIKVTQKGNSGIQYRGTERPDLGEEVVTGYQCDVYTTRPDYNGMLYEERERKILAHTGERTVIDEKGQPWVVGTFPIRDFKVDDWRQYRVLVEGNHYQHWIDDRQTVDVTDLDATGRKLEGVLGMQVHVGPAMKVQFRNFYYKRLPDDLPLITAEQARIPETALKIAPQGKDPAKKANAK